MEVNAYAENVLAACHLERTSAKALKNKPLEILPARGRDFQARHSAITFRADLGFRTKPAPV